MNYLTSALGQLDPQGDASAQLHEILRLGLDSLPLPGSGATLKRWKAMSLVAGQSLSLAKLYEGHTNALAILTELALPGMPVATANGSAWGVWAAEAANARVTITPGHGTAVRLNGTKCWCSGGQTLSHALLTAWHADGRGPQLVRVSMHKPGVRVSGASWQASAWWAAPALT